MMLGLLYLNIVWYSLAVLCVSANVTIATPHSTNIEKRDFQEDLKKFEIAIQTLLAQQLSSSKKVHSIDHSLGTKKLDKKVLQDEEVKGRYEIPRPENPTAIDLAFSTQKQRFKYQKYGGEFSHESTEGESKGRQQKQLQSLNRDSASFGTWEDDENGRQIKQNFSTGKKRIKPDNDKTQRGKKDFNNLMHEFRTTNFPGQNDWAIPDSIDLSFAKGQTYSPTTAATAKPTTLYWPPTTTSGPTPNQICRSKIDLGFLIEASKTVARTGPGNYRRLINFVKHVVLKFVIGPTATRIGAISYANRPTLMMGFNDGENIHDVLRFLNLPCHHCWNAQTGLALSFAQSYLYGCYCNYLRQRVLVVVTDGSSSDSVHIPSSILKQNGVQIIVVGVGRYFNIHQLNAMASRPANKNVFTGDWTKIHHVTNDLVRQICNAADGNMVPYSSSQTPCKCP